MKKNILLKLFLTIVCLINGISSVFAQTVYVSAWNPILYPSVVGQCGWEVQDNAATGSLALPYASWKKAWEKVLTNGGNNQTVSFLPDAYIQNYDYDNNGGGDNCLGHSLDASAVAGSTLNGLTIQGSTSGCGTYVSAGNGANSLVFLQLNGADNVTIKDMYFRNFSQTLTITDCQNLVIENCVFDANNNGASSLDGILITSLNRNTSVTFNNCKFLNNSSNTSTNAVTIRSNSTNPLLKATVSFGNCELMCGSKDNSGGAMMILGRNGVANALPTEINFTGGTFANNYATNAAKGGALYIGNNTKVSIDGTKFYNNHTHDAGGADGGGAIYIYSDGTTLSAAARTDVSINNAIFYGNYCDNTTSGGAISLQGASGHTNTNRPRLNISNSVFERNKAAGKGGAIYNSYGELNIDNCYFTKDTASTGGAVYVKNTSSVLSLTNSSFDNNYTAIATNGKDIFTDVDILSNTNSFTSAANVVGTPFPAFPAIDLFDRANSTTVGNSWTQTSGTSSINANHLLLGNTNDAWVSRTASGYNTILTNGSDLITWAFNFYSAATSGTKIGYFVLAANSPNFNAATTNGYAVKLNGTNIQLISFTGGLKTSNTSIIAGSSFTSSQTGSVKVIYDPNTDKWKLFDAVNSGDVLGSVNPRTATTQRGVATGVTNTTHVALNLAYMGAFWTPNASTSSSSVANFDDIYQSVGGANGTGWTGAASYSSAATQAGNYNCADYCAITVPGTCLAAQNSNHVCDIPNLNASISGAAFIDTNNDGINNDGVNGAAVPFANMFVVLYDSLGNVIGRTFTDANGNYSFSGLPNGKYYVSFVPQSSNPYATAPNASNANAATDSDMNPNIFTTGPIYINNALGTTNSNDANMPATYVTNVTAGFRSTPLILPAELISFEGSIENCKEAHLSWTTNKEIGVSHFDIYAQTYNNDFTLLGTVEAIGNSAEKTSYHFQNEQIKSSCFYKLAVIDINQTLIQSNVIEVKNACYEAIKLENNPVSEKLMLEFFNIEGNEAVVSIFDMGGQRVDFQTINVIEGINHSAINVAHLPKGLYNLRIIYSNSAKVIRFIKD